MVGGSQELRHLSELLLMRQLASGNWHLGAGYRSNFDIGSNINSNLSNRQQEASCKPQLSVQTYFKKIA